MPRLIRMSPSESNSTNLRSGRARASPKPKPACPPIAGSPSGASRSGLEVCSTQYRPPRPGTTSASPRWGRKTSSASAMRIMASSPSAVEAVIFVPDQHDNRPSGALGLLEGGGDAAGVGVALDEVVIETERHQEPLGVGRRGVGRDTVAGPAAIADHHHDRNVQAQQPATDRIAGFH